MSKRLYFDEKRMDIFDAPITRKIRISDFSNLASRRSSFSYTFEIPRTSNNLVRLDMISMQGNTSRKPFEKIEADYYEEGITVIEKGSAVIKETNERINVNIIDGFRSITEILGNSLVSELDLSEYDHDLTTEVMTDSFSNTSGYIYALADFGKGYGFGNVVLVENIAPSLFMHSVVEKIFEQAGITVSGDFFNNTHYKNELLVPTKGLSIVDDITETAKGGVTSTLIGNSTTPGTLLEKFTLVDNGLVGASVVSGEIVFSVAGRYSMQIDADYTIFDNYLYIEVRKNGTEIITQEIGDGTGTISLDKFVFNAESGDTISIYLTGTEVAGGSYDVDIDVDLFLRTNVQTIDVADYIGNIKQIDLINDVLNRYGVLVHPNGLNAFKFEHIEDILSDSANAQDWTDKISGNKTERYDSGYAKNNLLKYKYPSEIIVPTHDGSFEIDNVNTEDELTFLESIFEIPQTLSTLSGEDLYFIEIWQYNEDTEVYDNIEATPKVMQLVKFDESLKFQLFDERDGISLNTDIPYLALDDVDLQYFADNYFSEVKRVVEDFKKLEVEIQLSPIEVYNLDFFKLKYLKQYGRYFYLDSIQNTSGQLSKAILIQV